VREEVDGGALVVRHAGGTSDRFDGEMGRCWSVPVPGASRSAKPGCTSR
jgi:hypothetical protein